MALAIDASTPARFTAANDNPILSATFTPPAGALLVVCITADENWNNLGEPFYDVTKNGGGGPTFTEQVKEWGDGVENQVGVAAIYTAIVPSSVSWEVSVDKTGSWASGTARHSIKCYVVTGANTSDPTGAVGNGRSTTNNATVNAYTSTVANSLLIGCATDWNANGTPASTDTEDAAHYAGQLSVLSLYKASTTPTVGTTVQMNIDAGGTATAEWHWAAIEINPASGGSSSVPRPSRRLYLPSVHRASIW